MKKLSLSAIRAEFKSINGKSVNNVICQIYALLREAEANGIECKTIKTILPRSAKEAKTFAREIIAFGNVGTFVIRFVKDEEGKIIGHKSTIKPGQPSADMVLRYFLSEYNKNVPEAEVSKKAIKHECATRKAKECKSEKKQTANAMK